MRKVIGIYVDRMDIIHYPIAYVSKALDWFDQIYWFGSDPANTATLEQLKHPHPLSSKIRIVDLHHKIREPNDIGIAQNKCMQYMHDNDSATYLASQQADLCIVEDGIDILRKWTQNISRAVACLPAMQNKFFCETCPNPNGCVIMHRDCRYDAPGDGWDVKCYRDGKFIGPVSTPATNRARPMLDLGYISIAAYRMKLIGHATIWPDYDWKRVLLDIFNKDRRAGVKAALTRVSQYDFGGKPLKMVSCEDPKYKRLINDLGLHEDYLLIKTLIAELWK